MNNPNATDWVLVPREPTQEMLISDQIDVGEKTARKTWIGMLAEAPQPQVAPEGLGGLISDMERWCRAIEASGPGGAGRSVVVQEWVHKLRSLARNSAAGDRVVRLGDAWEAIQSGTSFNDLESQAFRAPHPNVIRDLTRSRDGWKAEADTLRERLVDAEKQLELMRAKQDGDVWFWEGDGHDHLHSMSSGMVVTIAASDLQTLVDHQQHGLQEQAELPTGQQAALTQSDVMRFTEALVGERGDLDAWLECHDETEVRAHIQAYARQGAPRAPLRKDSASTHPATNGHSQEPSQ